jgi:1-acyl-sn-glycerol-3-phosphate acyltransferase
VNTAWKYEPASDLDKSFVERLKNFPREPDLSVYMLRSCAALVIRAYLRAYQHLTIRGRENLPLDRSFVMVANHSSHLDAICLLAALPLRKLHRAFPAAAADYFFQSVPRIWLSAVMVNALPFSREAHIRQSLAICQHLLANPGNVLLIFPEGTRSRDGSIGSFRPGIGMLLAGKEIPVVPCYLDGAFRAWPKGKLLPRPRRVSLAIGTPRSFQEMESTRDSAQKVAANLEEAVRALAKSIK